MGNRATYCAGRASAKRGKADETYGGEHGRAGRPNKAVAKRGLAVWGSGGCTAARAINYDKFSSAIPLLVVAIMGLHAAVRPHSHANREGTHPKTAHRRLHHKSTSKRNRDASE